MDGRRYRARSIVRRARKSGRPAPERPDDVHDLETDTPLFPCAGVRTYKERVLALVGYSFAEFRRAVVLPQFEFRAFLDAETDTRARILKRVTGTDIYARLSMKAHERAGASRTRSTTSRRARSLLPVLPPEERTGAEGAGEGPRGDARARPGARDAAEADVRWNRRTRSSWARSKEPTPPSRGQRRPCGPR